MWERYQQGTSLNDTNLDHTIVPAYKLVRTTIHNRNSLIV